MSLRSVSTSDLNHIEISNWINAIFENKKEYMYVDGRTNYFSLAEDDFDIVILGSNDAVRAARFLKHGKPILNRRVKISLMTGSMPPRRAQVLTAGFDDVFDTTRTQPAEAVARIAAIWARYTSRVQAEQVAVVSRARIEVVAYFDAMSGRERQILQILLSKEGTFASYSSLQSQVSELAEGITFTHLKVIICELRKKLRPEYKISSRALLGYELHMRKSFS